MEKDSSRKSSFTLLMVVSELTRQQNHLASRSQEQAPEALEAVVQCIQLRTGRTCCHRWAKPSHFPRITNHIGDWLLSRHTTAPTLTLTHGISHSHSSRLCNTSRLLRYGRVCQA